MRITDFGIAKIFQPINSNETSGTPGYMSPEVIVGHNHNQVVDYFALGVLTYEFMMGIRPYTGKNRREIKEKIVATQFLIPKEKIPPNWSYDAADFINKLLQRKPANRLGLRSAKEVREHSWIKKYRWRDLYNKKIVPTFIPPQGDNFDKKYCNQEDKITPAMKLKYEKYLMDPLYQNAFENFDYYGIYLEEIKSKSKTPELIKNGKNFILEEFVNPHLNIKNYDEEEEKNNNNENLNNESNFNEIEENVTEENFDEIEKKLVKNNQEQNSASNQILMRHYKKMDNYYMNAFVGNIDMMEQNKENNIQIDNDIIGDDEEE